MRRAFRRRVLDRLPPERPRNDAAASPDAAARQLNSEVVQDPEHAIQHIRERTRIVEQPGDRTQQVAEESAGPGHGCDEDHDLRRVHIQSEQIEVNLPDVEGEDLTHSRRGGTTETGTVISAVIVLTVPRALVTVPFRVA